jgi:thiosulfate dehydrogenase
MDSSKRHLVTVVAALLSCAGAAAADPAPADTELVARGRYLAQVGDCVACHTATDGPAMAGGRVMATPFGTLTSTNITPDRRTGIGGYSLADFDRAVRRGVAADGHNLYPAMPYPSYARITGDDLRALYAYFMHGVAPVERANRPAEMSWPFNMRFGLAVWDRVFPDATPFTPDPGHDAVWNRGAYLVQGLGHCGACHTPRGIAFQEKAMGDAGDTGRHFLAGATVEDWRAPSLRNLWTVDDTVALLKTGQNRLVTVSGNMTEVIHFSTQNFTDADLVAVATYLKSLPAGTGEVPMPAPAAAPAAGLFTTRGGLAYLQFCADCHRRDGAGVTALFPPLAGNPAVVAADPATLVHIMLTGGSTAETAGRPRVWAMPDFAQLSDGELAEIAGFVRTAWGNVSAPVTAADVERARVRLGAKAVGASTFGTPRLADMLGRPDAAQLVRGMRLHLQTKALLPDNVGNDLNCTSCHLNVGTVANGSPFVGVSAAFPSYAPRSGRVISLEDRINGCFKRSMNGKPLPVDSAEMKAMVAYFDWMKGAAKPESAIPGRGVGKVAMTIQPDEANGRKVYLAQCAVCHGQDGEGLRQAGGGGLVFPPLWGAQSFNLGAGMARTYTAAAFVKNNMPVGFHDHFPLGQGGLSDQEAVDVAQYFSHQPRPDFAEKANDWPKDKKPADSRY